MSLLKDFTQNLEDRNLVENNLTQPAFELLNQMSSRQIELYIQQAQSKNYELIIQTNPTEQYKAYREITGCVTKYDEEKERILVDNKENNIVFVIPLNSIRFIRRSQ